MTGTVLAVSPALVLSLIVGALHTCLYLLLRGQLRPHLALVLAGAIIGAWVGQAIGGRLGDPARLGDYSLLWASACAWLGIGVALAMTRLGGLRGRQPSPPTPAPGTEDA